MIPTAHQEWLLSAESEVSPEHNWVWTLHDLPPQNETESGLSWGQKCSTVDKALALQEADSGSISDMPYQVLQA